MPTKLSPEAQEVYDRQLDILTTAGRAPPLDVLRAYAVAVAEMDSAQVQLDRTGPVANVNGVVQSSPYLAVRDRAGEKVERLGLRLGLLESAVKPHDKEDPYARYSTTQVIEALRRAKGVKLRAAAILGCKRRLVEEYIAREPEVTAEYLDIMEMNKDLAEAALLDAVEAEKAFALCFFLRTRAADRGYADNRRDLKPSDDMPTEYRESSMVPMTGLTLEERRDLERILRSRGAPKLDA